MKSPQCRILDDVWNIGFLHGLGGLRDISTLSLINNLSSYDDFHPTEGLDLMIEYESGFKEGMFTRKENLLKEKD